MNKAELASYFNRPGHENPQLQAQISRLLREQFNLNNLEELRGWGTSYKWKMAFAPAGEHIDRKNVFVLIDGAHTTPPLRRFYSDRNHHQH